MKFIREIGEEKIDDKMVLDLEQFGYTLVYTENSIEIWAECGEFHLSPFLS